MVKKTIVAKNSKLPKFNRILTKKTQKAVTKYINILKKDKLPIQAAIVFGSQVKKTARKDSDIDICIISPKFKDPFKAMKYLMMKSYQIDAYIEPHPYNPKQFVNENPVVWEIKKTGIKVPLRK